MSTEAEGRILRHRLAQANAQLRLAEIRLDKVRELVAEAQDEAAACVGVEALLDAVGGAWLGIADDDRR